jgi:transposase
MPALSRRSSNDPSRARYQAEDRSPGARRAFGKRLQDCRYFGISRETFYQWKRAYESAGEEGLVNNRPGFRVSPRRTPPEIEEKILLLRRRHHFGPVRIVWYLKRYHGISMSSGGVYYVLKRNGMNRLPRNMRKRSITSSRRYEKQVPGHHVQIDVKFRGGDLRVTVEPGIDEGVLRRLEALGHVLTRRSTYGGVGGGQGILFDAVTGVMMGGSTPHKDGAAVAW